MRHHTIIMAAEGGTPDASASDGAMAAATSSLFWEEMPSDFESHPDYIAMQAAMGEMGAYEKAEEWKVQGNDKLKLAKKSAYQRTKKRFYREAIYLYTKAIDTARGNDGDAETTAASVEEDVDAATLEAFVGVCFSNRSYVNLLIQNFRSALADAIEAIAIDAGNKKAHYRAVKAALGLRDAERAEELLGQCDSRFKGDADFAALGKELAQAKGSLAEEARRLEAALKDSTDVAIQFSAMLKARGIKVGWPSFPDISNRPYFDEQGHMHWPAVLVYPEPGQLDLIADFPETATFDEMLTDEMFPLPWDAEVSRSFVRAAIDCSARRKSSH